MGFRLEFDAAHKILLISFSGVLTDDVWAAPYELFRTVAYPHPDFALVDYREVTAVEISSECLRRVSYNSPIMKHCVRVCIAPQPVMFGLSRMLKVYAENSRPIFHVVRTMEEALDFIRVESPSFSPLQLGPSHSV